MRRLGEESHGIMTKMYNNKSVAKLMDPPNEVQT